MKYLITLLFFLIVSPCFAETVETTKTSTGSDQQYGVVGVFAPLSDTSTWTKVQEDDTGEPNDAEPWTTTLSSVTSNNLIVTCFSGNKNIATITAPSGFTKFQEGAGTGVSGAMAYKISTGGETTVEWSSASDPGELATVWTAEYSGNATSSVLTASAEDASNVSSATSSQSTGTTSDFNEANELAVACIASDTGTNVDDHVSWTNDFIEIAGSIYGNNGGLQVATKILPIADLTLTDVTLRQDTYTDYCADANCLGCWRFNSDVDNKAIDESGEDHHGTVGGAAYITDGSCQEGNCWDFDGTDDFISIGNQSTTLADAAGTYDASVVFWAEVVAYENAGVAFSWRGTDDLNYYPYDNNSGANGVRVFWRDLGGNIFLENTTSRTGWHHFAFVTRASNDHEAFVDGVSVATSSDTGTSGPWTDFNIAYFPDDSGQEYNGKLDEMAVFDRALTDAEITDIYTNGLK